MDDVSFYLSNLPVSSLKAGPEAAHLLLAVLQVCSHFPAHTGCNRDLPSVADPDLGSRAFLTLDPG